MLDALNSILLLKRLRKNLKLPKAELETIQQKKLHALINHAYENVPYYRRLFNSAGLRPESIQRIEDLEKLPITDKTAMRSMEKNEIMARNLDPGAFVEVFTSGSTGMPATIYFTQEDYRHLDLVYLRSFLQNGLR